MPLSDRLKIDLTRLKGYLKIEYSDDDALLTDLSKMAKDQIELYLNNDFTELGDGGELVEKPIPLSLNLAVYQMVGAWYETRSLGVQSKSVGGVTYQLGQAPIETIKILMPYRKLVGL